jgi:hypothetical protein
MSKLFTTIVRYVELGSVPCSLTTFRKAVITHLLIFGARNSNIEYSNIMEHDVLATGLVTDVWEELAAHIFGSSSPRIVITMSCSRRLESSSAPCENHKSRLWREPVLSCIS